MSTYYNLYTRATIEEVKGNNKFSIEEMEPQEYRIKDIYNNYLWINTNEEGVIYKLRRYGSNDPTFIIYTLIKEFNSEILSEYQYKPIFHESVENDDPEYIKDKTQELKVLYTQAIKDHGDKLNFERLYRDVSEFSKEKSEEFKSSMGYYLDTLI